MESLKISHVYESRIKQVSRSCLWYIEFEFLKSPSPSYLTTDNLKSPLKNWNIKIEVVMGALNLTLIRKQPLFNQFGSDTVVKQERRIELSCSILDTNMKKCLTKKAIFTSCTNFATICQFSLLDAVRDYLHNGSVLVLVFDIAKYYLSTDVDVVSASKQSLTKPEDTKKSGRLSKLLNDQLFCDFKIVVKDKTFPVSKAILASQSDYFLDLFTSNSEDSVVPDKLILSEKDPAVVELVLNYVYKGKMETPDTLDLGLLFSIFDIAHLFRLDDLKVFCELELEKHITTSSWVQIVLEADKYECESLKNKVYAYVRKYYKDIPESVLNEIAESSPKIVKEVLKILQCK